MELRVHNHNALARYTAHVVNTAEYRLLSGFYIISMSFMDDKKYSLEELARQVGDSSICENERKRIFAEKIVPKIEEPLRELFRRFYYQYKNLHKDQTEFFDEITPLLENQLLHGNHSFAEGKSFLQWCRVVVSNHVCECFRKKRKPLGSAPPPSVLQAVNFELIGSLNIREEMDRFAKWYNEQEKQNEIHYAAVLCLELRLRVEKFLAFADPNSKPKPNPKPNPNRNAAALVPWNEHEELWKIQPSWPNLHEIWTLLDEQINTTFQHYFQEDANRRNCIITQERFCKLVGHKMEGEPLNVNAWTQYVTQARNCCRDFPGRLDSFNALLRICDQGENL